MLEPADQLASYAERLIGRLVDLVISVAVGIVIALPAQGDLSAGDFSMWAMAAAIVLFAWETAWVATTGASVGKHLAGTRVAPAGWRQSAVRATPRLLWGFPLGSVVAVPIGLISLVMMFTRSDHRTLADLAARTCVIKGPQPSGSA